MRTLPFIPGKAHYGQSYDSKRRFASYWHQLDECRTIGGKSVLIVGKGSGIATNLLEGRGFNVTTVDLQKDLGPTVLADLRQLPFTDQAFDIAVCCEVLEHLPFKDVLPAICELRRMIRRGIVLSVPDRSRYSKVIPYFLFRRRVLMDLPDVWLKRWKFDGEHYWELGTRDHRRKHFQRIIERANLKTEHTFRVWEFPYHRFWRLRLS